MPDSEDETDDFFALKAPIRVPSPSVPPPNKRRKSSHQSSAEDDSDASAGSSELEILGSSGSKSRKGKAKAKGGQARKRGNQVLAAPRRLEINHKKTESLSVDSSPEPSPGPSQERFIPSLTQLNQGGGVLEEMARQKGWEGEARPPRENRAEAGPVAGSSSSESSETTGTRKRRTSASTAATSFSDKSSSAAKGKGKAKASPKQRTAPKKRTTRASRSPSIELEQPPYEQPAPPESLWGGTETSAGVLASKKKHEHGEATKRFREMSKLKPVLPADNEEDDIIDSSQGTEEDDARPRKYETVKEKADRERAEAKAALVAKREAKQAARAPPKPAPAPKAGAQPSINAQVQMTECLVCSTLVARAQLDAHTRECFDCAGDNTQALDDGSQPAAAPRGRPPVPDQRAPSPPHPPPRSIPRPPPFAKRQIAIPPSSADDGYIDSSVTEIARQDDLAAELFPPSPKRFTAASKGKGRAVVPEVEEEAEQPPDDIEYGYGDDNEDGGMVYCDDEEFEYDDDDDEGCEDPADFVKLQGTTNEAIEIESDDDETVQVATKVRLGAEGAVNTGRAKGPPQNGSPPPTGSIYISTLSHAMRMGYAQMYRERSPKKGAPSRTDPLAPQKMTAAAKPFRPRARRGYGGPRRGGGRKATKSRK